MTTNLLGNLENNTTSISGKKRGRKSKKEIEEAKKMNEEYSKINSLNVITNENIVVNIEENSNLHTLTLDSVNEIVSSKIIMDDENQQTTLNIKMDIDNNHVAKKRGRKPNGGKIIQQIMPLNNNKETKPNIILHLKCCLNDLYASNLLGNVDGYSFSNQNKMSHHSINNDENVELNEYTESSTKLLEYEYEYDNKSNVNNNECETKNKDNDIRDIWKKIKTLEHKLHINCIDNKKSACFWDTCEFDNPPIYIPKYFMNDMYHVYGCFCSPECAVAYLMEENIDSSIKFERYYLMNHIYSKIYNYTKNIKPAPNPYYMLEKYYGNLSIQEYRSLLRNERLFLVVDKPLTRIMPELHEDNDDFIINNKIIPSNAYQIKKNIQKKQTKTNILSEKFGLV
jgi:hypothetical protein